MNALLTHVKAVHPHAEQKYLQQQLKAMQYVAAGESIYDYEESISDDDDEESDTDSGVEM